MRTLDMSSLEALSRIADTVGPIVAEAVAAEVQRRNTAGSSGDAKREVKVEIKAEVVSVTSDHASEPSADSRTSRTRSLECRLHSGISACLFT